MFQVYMSNLNKSYHTLDEFQLRFHYFDENLKIVNKLNKFTEGTRFAVNQFSDWSNEEYLKFTGSSERPSLDLKMDTQLVYERLGAFSSSNIVYSKNWVDDNAVTYVKN